MIAVIEWLKGERLCCRQLEAQRRKERNEAHLYMNVQVLLEDAFFGYQGNDLFDTDRVQYRCVKAVQCTLFSIVSEHVVLNIPHMWCVCLADCLFGISLSTCYKPFLLFGIDADILLSSVDSCHKLCCNLEDFRLTLRAFHLECFAHNMCCLHLCRCKKMLSFLYHLYLLLSLHFVFSTFCNTFIVVDVPSVLWRCWLGGRKGIRPVKNWVVGCWRGYLSGARCRLAYGPADATATHCLLLQ